MATPKTFHIGIKAVIVNNGKALVLKDEGRYPGFDLPGGKIDKGEGIETALKRELYEELGLKKFTIGELINVFERFDYNQKGIGLMLVAFRVKAKLTKIKLDKKEHSGFSWISKKEFTKLVKTNEFRNRGVIDALAKVLK